MTHIIIPMSGSGERFLRAGYKEPKPLLVVDGQPMIKYVISMFSPLDKFTFVCNEEHLQTTRLANVLTSLVPNGSIVSIPPHKLGPVFAVSQCFDKISDDEEVIVNYCDFYSYWDYQDFLAKTRLRKAAGAIPAYKGFHPHMLGKDNYAFIKESNLWLESIQEKKPFTSDRMSEFASDGTYYFLRGQYVKHYFSKLIEKNIEVNGEYYVSMVYNLLVEDKLPVSIYEIEHMLQWGTPHDLAEYQHWSDYFAQLAKPKTPELASCKNVDICLIPMAGKGARFTAVGYNLPKPLIPVSGKPMVIQACDNLPIADRYIFVALKEHTDQSNLEQLLNAQFKNTSIVKLAGVTEGQAITCEIGLLKAMPPVDLNSSLLIGACDNGMVYDKSAWQSLMSDHSIDVAAISFRNHPSSEINPQMYGWLKTDTQSANSSGFPIVTGVSVKQAISNEPRKDHAVVGAFFFRKASYFIEALKILKEKGIRVSGEFYVDSMMDVLPELGLKCVAFEVSDYICFGTPNDLKMFEYWQSFFHKCSWHPYSITKDPFANSEDENLQARVHTVLR